MYRDASRLISMPHSSASTAPAITRALLSQVWRASSGDSSGQETLLSLEGLLSVSAKKGDLKVQVANSLIFQPMFYLVLGIVLFQSNGVVKVYPTYIARPDLFVVGI